MFSAGAVLLLIGKRSSSPPVNKSPRQFFDPMQIAAPEPGTTTPVAVDGKPTTPVAVDAKPTTPVAIDAKPTTIADIVAKLRSAGIPCHLHEAAIVEGRPFNGVSADFEHGRASPYAGCVVGFVEMTDAEEARTTVRDKSPKTDMTWFAWRQFVVIGHSDVMFQDTKAALFR
jgi:hypothetical protein